MDKIIENLPDNSPDGPLDGQKGLLSPFGDPIGHVLEKGLGFTVGRLTGAIGVPNGEAFLAVKLAVKKQMGIDNEEPTDEEVEEALRKADKENQKPAGERIGGNVQNGQNPLGL